MKRLFALFISITMLLSIAPIAMASTVISLPTGNSAGRLTSGLTVKVGSSSALSETQLLTDGFHYSTSERMKLGVRPQNDAGAKMVTLDSTNNIIEFSWEEAQTVCRLEMWVWRVGAIKDYSIQISEDGESWDEWTTGSFDRTQSLPGDDTTRGGAAAFYLAQFDELTTKYLRFVVTAFGNGQTSAYVAEAIPRSSDSVNLLGDLTLSKEFAYGNHLHAGDNNKYPWTQVNASSYAFGFNASAWKHLFQSANLSGYSLKHSDCQTWQSFTSGYPTMTLANATDKDYAFYSTSFMASPQKINRIKIPAYSGSINEVEIYYSQASSWPGESSADWKKLLTAKAAWSGTGANAPDLHIANAPQAEYWMAKVTDFEGNLKIYPIEMYSLREESLTPFAKATGSVFDNINDSDDNIVEETFTLSDEISYGSNTYSVKWATDSSLVDIETGAVTPSSTEVPVTLTATVTDETANVSYSVSRGFVIAAQEEAPPAPVNGVFTFGEGVVFEDETDSSLLDDGFYYVAGEINDTNCPGATTKPADNPQNFAKFTQVDSGIEYIWENETTVKRLELWMWRAGAVKDYEIQVSDDGEVWTKHAEGSLDQTVTVADANLSAAVFYPVLFDSVTTKHLRFVIKSFKDASQGAYISEVKHFENNNTNLTGTFFFKNIFESLTSTGAHVISPYTSGFYVSETAVNNTAYLKNSPYIWPFFWNKTLTTVTPDPDGTAWYATTTGNSPIAVNRVSYKITSGSAKGIEVLSSNDKSSLQWVTNPARPDTVGNYDIDGAMYKDITGEGSIDMSGVSPATCHLVKFTGCSSDFKLESVGMYTLADDELDSASKVVAEVFENISTDTDKNDEAIAKITLPESITYGEDNYYLQWSCDSELINLETGDIELHENDVRATFVAKILDGTMEDTGYSAAGIITLKGTPNEFTTGTFGNGVESSDEATKILSDGFLYNLVDRSYVVPLQVYAYQALDKFVKFSETESGIQFNWTIPTMSKRLDLWVWKPGMIRDYEIQVSDNGKDWITHYSGNFDQYGELPADNASAAANAQYHPISFSEVKTKHLRFVIKSFADAEQGAYISEATIYDNDNINFNKTKRYNDLYKDMIDAYNEEQLKLPQDERGNKYGDIHKYSMFTNEYYSSNTSGNLAGYIKNSNIVWPGYSNSTGLLNITPDDEADGGNLWYATRFDMAKIKVNRVTFDIAGGTVKQYEVWAREKSGASVGSWIDNPPIPYLTDTTGWKKVVTVNGEFTKDTDASVDIGNAPEANGWMLVITDYTGKLAVSSIGMYQICEDDLDSLANDCAEVFDKVSDSKLDNVIVDKMNIPASLTINGNTYEVNWESSSDRVNTSTGAVTPSVADEKMTLTAKIGYPAGDYKYVLQKEYFLHRNDSRNKTYLFDEKFTSSLEDTFKEVTGSVSVNGGEAILSGDAKASYDLTLDYGFEYHGRKEIILGLRDGSNGTIRLKGKGNNLLELLVTEDSFTAAYKDGTFSSEFDSKIMLAVENDRISIYPYDGEKFGVALYDAQLSSDKLLDEIEFVSEDGKSLSVNEFSVSVIGDDLLTAVENQLDFGKISDYGALNLNGNLRLIDKFIDITFDYASTDENVVNPDTGVVDASSYNEENFTVTAASASAGRSFEKTFKVFVGKKNVFADAKSNATVKPLDGKEAVNAIDCSYEDEFITNSRQWRIGADLQSSQKFNKIRIIESDTTERISEFTISISTDNINFTEVYTGTAIDSATLIEIPYTDARFVRINVSKTTGAGTGIRDVLGYLEMTDSEMLAVDVKTVTDSFDVKDGALVPKTGEYGTVFTVTSNNDAVKIEDAGENWKITVITPSKEQNVTVTLSAVKGSASDSKSYNKVVLTGGDIRDNELPSSGSIGGGGSSGGGSGGGGSSSGGSSVSFPTAQAPVAPLRPADELEGHWGEKEIRYLVEKGIVQGDGNGYNLGGNVTRAEFSKMIIKAFGYETVKYNGSFTDVAGDDWYADIAETALKYGIMKGDGNNFRGNAPISRQEMSVVLINVLKSQQEAVSSDEVKTFTDSADIAAWAADSVKLASGLGLLNGYETGDFKPNANLRRDEAMVVVYRAIMYAAN